MQVQQHLVRVVMMSCFALGAIGMVQIAPMSDAQAQGWNVQGGNKRKAEIIRRYKLLLEKQPTEGLFFKKLLQETGKGAGLDRLIVEYQKKAKAYPKQIKYWLILGHFLKAKARYDEAYKAYDEAVKLNDKNPLGYLGRGATAMMLNKNKEAEADFEKALAMERNKAKKQQILRKLADIAFAQRDWDNAQKYYDKLIALQPRNQYLRMEYAQVLVKYKRYDKALDQYKALVKLAGRNVKARATTLRDMGDLYERMGSDNEALETYRKAMGYVKAGNWLYRELQQRIIGVYRRSDKLSEFVADRIKKWRSPNYDQAMMLASIYDELGEEKNALKYYTLASNKNRRSVDPRVKIIQILQRRGDNKSVVKNYEALIRVAPSQWRFRFDLAKLHFRNGERKKAVKVLDGIRSRFRRDPDAMVTLADTYMRLAMKEKALAVYKSLVKSYPRNDSFIVSLGEYYYQSGEVEKAIGIWKRVLKSDLSKSEAYAKLGHVLVDHNMLDKGIQYYEQAAKLAPKDRETLRGLAVAYESARRWNKAIEVWKRIMALKNQQPQSVAEARTKIINLYHRQSRLRPMMREFEERFDNKPPDLEAGYFLAEAHNKLNEFKKAEAIYKKIIQADGVVDKQDINALMALEKSYSSSGRLKEAIEVLQQLAKLRPLRAKEYYYRIAELSLKSYEDKKAVEYAKLALEKNPDDAASHARLAAVYAKMQQVDKAIKSYRTSIELDPRAFKNYMALAELLMGKGDLEGANKLYRTIAQKAYDDQMILRAARKSMSMATTYEQMELLEGDLVALVFKTPPKPVYRKIALELYSRMVSPLVAQRHYGTGDSQKVSKRINAISARAYPVLMDALQSEDVGHRQAASKMLGQLGQGNAALTLARMVGDKREPLRLQAAVAVALIGDARATSALVRALKDPNGAIRQSALWALGASGGKDATPSLGKLLNSGNRVHMRSLAAIGLGRIGHASGVPHVRKALKRYQSGRFSDNVSVALLWAVGKLKDKESRATLETAIKQGGKDAKVAAAWSLASLGQAEDVKILFKAYWSGDEDQRQAARLGLLRMSAKMQNALPEDKDPKFYKLRQVNREVQYLKERNQYFDVESMFAQFKLDIAYTPMVNTAPLMLKHKAAIKEVLGGRMATRNAKLQQQILQDLTTPGLTMGLGVSGSADEQKQLKSLHQQWLGSTHKRLKTELNSNQDARMIAALPLLGEIGDAGDLSAIKKAASHTKAEVRQHAILALANGFKTSSGVSEIIAKGMKDNHYVVRAAAAQAAASLSSSTEMANTLMTLLNDSFSTVQLNAASTLGVWKHAAAVEKIQPLLDKVNPDVKVAMVAALHEIGTSEAKKLIEPYTSSYDLTLRRAALGVPQI